MDNEIQEFNKMLIQLKSTHGSSLLHISNYEYFIIYQVILTDIPKTIYHTIKTIRIPYVGIVWYVGYITHVDQVCIHIYLYYPYLCITCVY